MMNEVSVDAAEEIELLIKWLGPISPTYARSIKISNVLTGSGHVMVKG